MSRVAVSSVTPARVALRTVAARNTAVTLMTIVVTLCALTTIRTAAAQSSAAEAPTIKTLGIQACAFTDPPALTDGTTASRQEMEQLADQMRDYAQTMQASLACLDASAADIPAEHRALVDSMYNNGVEQLNYIVEEYNRQVKLYRRMERLQPPTNN